MAVQNQVRSATEVDVSQGQVDDAVLYVGVVYHGDEFQVLNADPNRHDELPGEDDATEVRATFLAPLSFRQEVIFLSEEDSTSLGCAIKQRGIFGPRTVLTA